MKESKPSWTVLQIGAREHYSVARALHAQGRLGVLFTDAWVKPGNPLGRLKRPLRERYHPELAAATVACANGSWLAFEATARVKGLKGWSRVVARNKWFQRQAVRPLCALSRPALS